MSALPSHGDGIAQPTRPSTSSMNAKLQQLESITVRCPADGDRHVSNFAQAPVDNLDTSMRAGYRGPTEIADPVARGESGPGRDARAQH